MVLRGALRFVVLKPCTTSISSKAPSTTAVITPASLTTFVRGSPVTMLVKTSQRSTAGPLAPSVSYFAFAGEAKAREFERYLNSGSGKTFANRHFL